MIARAAYVAYYPGLYSEVIVARDTFWSPALDAAFDAIAGKYPLVQGWYSDAEQVKCMAVARGSK